MTSFPRCAGLLGAVLFAAPVFGQSQTLDWASQIQSRWPGASVGKATEAEFERFLDSSGARAQGAKEVATTTFLDLQWAAHGLTRPEGLRRFLSPERSGAASPGSLLDGAVFEGPEPNGNPNGTPAGTPTMIDCGDQGEGAVFPFGDRDWWQIDVTTGGLYTFWTMDGPSVPAIGDTLLELYDGSGVLLDANDDADGRGFYSELSADLMPGRYFVVVRGYADVRTGSYGLEVICGSSSGGGGGQRIAEGPEPNNTNSTSTQLGCSNIGTGTIPVAFDEDYWSFTLSGTSLVTGFTAGGPTGGMDTTLTLYNSSGTQLAFDDDGGPGTYSLIIRTLQAGTYYFSAAGWSSSTGDYELTVTCAGTGGGGSMASFDAVPGGCPGTAGTPRVFARDGELPLAGSTFAVDVDGLPAGARVLMVVGDSTSMAPGGTPLPIDLTPLGAPGCQVEVGPEVIVDRTASAAGRTTVYFGIPSDSQLIGSMFFVQALVIDPGANALQLTASNRGEATVGTL